MHYTKYGYNGVPEYLRSINATDCTIKQLTVNTILLEYKFHPNVLQFGTEPELDFQESSLGCKDNLSIDYASELCNNADDCNSFFVYDSQNDTRICFKNNI